jgi:hypothetical protein
VCGYFQLFDGAGLQPRSSWPLPPE